jgi:hypothetical protein
MTTVTATFVLTGWNGPQLANRVATIMTAYGKELDLQLKQEIKTVQYPWPGITYRKNGTIEGSPRDIVDTGRFLASQRRTRPNATTLQFTWGGSAGVNYAGIILSGRPDTAAYPGRNWIERALKNKPLDEFFGEQWSRLEGRGL